MQRDAFRPIQPPLPRPQVDAALSGDAGAYAAVVARLQNTLTGLALAVVGDRTTSEDIAQEAFLRGWQERHRLRSAESLLPWLRQVTRNLARDHLRGLAVRRPLHAGLEAAGDVADPAAPPERMLDAEHQRIALREAIDALPEDTRETVLLYFREGEDPRAVGALLGLSEAAVRKRVSRARQALREDLLSRVRALALASAPSAGFGSALAAALAASPGPAVAGATFGASSAALAGKGAAGPMGGLLATALGGLLLGLAGLLIGLRLRAPDTLERDDACIRLATSWFAVVASVVLTAGMLHLGGAALPGGWRLAGVFLVSLAAGALAARWVPRWMIRRGYRPGTGSRRSIVVLWAGIVVGLCAGVLGYVLGARWLG